MFSAPSKAFSASAFAAGWAAPGPTWAHSWASLRGPVTADRPFLKNQGQHLQKSVGRRLCFTLLHPNKEEEVVSAGTPGKRRASSMAESCRRQAVAPTATVVVWLAT